MRVKYACASVSCTQCALVVKLEFGGRNRNVSRITFRNSFIPAITASRWCSGDSMMFMTYICGIIIKNLLSTFLKSIMRT